jgi:hypothetical protein
MSEVSLVSTGSPTADDIARHVDELLLSANREVALRYAMKAVEPLLESPSDALRFELHNKVFEKFATESYQSSDFESVDYNGFELSKRLPLFRGPRPPEKSLADGDYFCVLGAAQTFGRLVKNPWPNRLSRKIGLPVLNLGRGGAGPEFFLRDDLLPLAQRAQFVVLQVMSGRSIGCSEYPGGRRTILDGQRINRLLLLNKLWNKDRANALEYVKRWNTSYFKMYKRLSRLIGRPIILVWISNRAPQEWAPEKILDVANWGAFPQLVGLELYQRTAALFAAQLEYVERKDSEHPWSRITGQPCPYFGTENRETALLPEFYYYPTTRSHREVADGLEPLAMRIC